MFRMTPKRETEMGIRLGQRVAYGERTGTVKAFVDKKWLVVVKFDIGKDERLRPECLTRLSEAEA